MKINAVPQFQGALTERAPELPAGCIALADFSSQVLGLPINRVPQVRDTSPIEAGVANRAVLTGPNLDAQREAVSGVEEPILTIGGDCGIQFEPISAARRRYGAGLGVAWFDAHPDLNTPETSLNGAYHAMVLRGLMGEGDPKLTADEALDPSKVALVDVRGADAAERAAIERGLGIQTDEPATVLRGVSHLYVHVDLDILDPSEFEGHNMPEPNGWTIPQLVASLDSLKGFNIVGAGMTECVGTPEQVQVLAPVITKLGELLQQGKP